MRDYICKMGLIILVLSVSIIIYKNNNNKERILYSNYIKNNIYEVSNFKTRYEKIVFEEYTLSEISNKIDNVFNSTISGYGRYVAEISLNYDVDPFIAAGIILVETGCKWNCSYLAKNCNNIGGMKGTGCGSYSKFDSLDAGIEVFIKNLAYNYYRVGLNTLELINKKYAENPNWHKDVNYYIKLIKES